MRLSLPILLLAALLPTALAFAQASQPNPWAPPVVAVAPAQLPALGQPLVLDGKLAEWANAVCVPIHSPATVAFLYRTRVWHGPTDAGMEVYCAWNPEGLCLATVVSDDDVRNNIQTVANLYQQDCVEVFIDGRAGAKFMQPPYSAGCMQLFAKPPTEGAPAALENPSPKTPVTGLKIAAVRTATDYTMEMLIPWSNFPEFTPESGSSIALQFALDDYDARDGSALAPMQLTGQGATGLFMSPQRFIPWTLVEKAQVDGQAPAAPFAILTVPKMLTGENPLSVSVDIGPTLARAKAVRFRVTDTAGNALWERTVKTAALAAPWSGARSATLENTMRVKEDGYYLVNATLLDKSGKSLGTLTRPVLYAGNIQEAFYARAEKIDITALSQTDPYKAAAYLGAFSCIEKVKRACETTNAYDITRAIQEATLRFDLLEGKTLDKDVPGLFDLLALEGDPQAQVNVTYPIFIPDQIQPVPTWSVAYVTYNWGPVPLAFATVQQYPDADRAVAAMEALDTGGLLSARVEQFVGEGKQMKIITRQNATEAGMLTDFQPGQQVLLVSADARSGNILNLADIDMANVDGVVLLDSCPNAVRDAVNAWTKSKHLATLSLADGLGKQRVLIAGDVRVKEVTDSLKVKKFSTGVRVAETTRVVIRAGNRIISAESPSRVVAQRAAELVLAGKAVTPADVDAMRKALVSALAPHNAATPLPESQHLYFGDLHMHTFYSDGLPSPVGLALQGMHSYLDFAIISDHNAIAGAQLAQRLFTEHHVAFPLTVGEEMSLPWIHMNAYPLTKLIDWEMPLYDIVKAAHVQGAMIQWNHPGYPGTKPDWDYAHMKNAGAGLGFDAWEHAPASYDRWKQQGMLPVITSGTDTHTTVIDTPERAIIISPSPQGDDIAEAVRLEQVVVVSADQGHYLYGPDALLPVVWAALEEGTQLKADTAEHLKTALQHADLIGLLRASEPRVAVSTDKP